MPQRGLLDLPVETLIEILKFLQICDLVSSRAICRRFRNTVKGSLELQYKIELFADNMLDGPRFPGSLNTMARFERLLDRRRRWRQLDWAKMTTISLPGDCQAYEMVGGVFAKSMGGPTVDGWSGARHLTLTWLPSRTQDAHSIIREDLGVMSRDFAIDPTQDLIALVVISDSAALHLQIRVHLRTMSQNRPHPRAPRPILTASIPLQVGSCFVQVVDDVVGMFFWVHGPGFVVWNWRTGERIVERTGFDVPIGTWDFGFLSSRVFMLTTIAASGSIQLFSFEKLPPRHVATLHLPALQEGMEIRSFTAHSAPFLANPVGHDIPFTTSQNDRIHVMSLQYGERGAFRALLLIKNSSLMQFVPGFNNDRTDSDVISLQWEEWGPKNTRFLDCHIRSSWLRYVHGQRIILPKHVGPPPTNKEKPMQTVCLMDFNVHPKRIDDPCDALIEDHSTEPSSTLPLSASSSNKASHYTYKVVAEPTIVRKSDVFTTEVVSHLPYSFSTRAFSADYAGFMIDEERLAGMRRVAFAEASWDPDMDIFVF